MAVISSSARACWASTRHVAVLAANTWERYPLYSYPTKRNAPMPRLARANIEAAAALLGKKTRCCSQWGCSVRLRRATPLSPGTHALTDGFSLFLPSMAASGTLLCHPRLGQSRATVLEIILVQSRTGQATKQVSRRPPSYGARRRKGP
jgi:hypothetical protein